MSWFLTQKKIGVAAALFALLIQLAASFGHIHSQTVNAHASLTLSISDHSHGSLSGGADEPDGYICDICAALSLAASAQVAIPPALPTRFALRETLAPPTVDTAPRRSPRVEFRSRAPPFA